MISRELRASASIRLIAPSVVRDAPLSVEWLADPHGRETLRLMGVARADNHAMTLEQEQDRVREFIARQDQYNWMIETDSKIVGSIWVDLKPTPDLSAPSVSFMIGDRGSRGQGAASAALAAVIGFMRTEAQPRLFSRHIDGNIASDRLLRKLGFTPEGDEYVDPEDGFRWQNFVLDLKSDN